MNLASLGNGYIIGWPSVAIPVLSSPGPDNPLSDNPLTKEGASWVASSTLIVATLFSFAFSSVCSRWGRKAAGYLVATTQLGCWVCILLSTSLVPLIVGRCFAGLASIGLMVCAPLYVTEISQNHVRGALGLIFVVMFNGGVLVAYCLGAVLSYNALIYVGLAMPIAFVACFYWLPESPIYLLMKGDTESSRRALQWFRGKRCDVNEELEDLRVQLKEESGSGTILDLFRTRGSRRALLIGEMLGANQQFSGIFVVLSFTVDIFRESGSSLSPNTSTIVIGLLLLLASAVSSMLIDRAGRKVLLVASNIIVGACLAALGTYFYLKSSGADVAALWWLPVVSLSVYIVAAALGVASLFFVVITEIFAPQVRGIATSLALSSINAFAFLVTVSYGLVASTLGSHVCFWFYGTCCAASAIYIVLCVPETKGRPIDDIVRELSGVARKESKVYSAVSTKA